MGADGANFKYKAFISYAHEDGELADAVKHGLEQLARPRRARRVFRVFLDRETLPAGDDLPARLLDSLDDSEFLVLVASRDSARSDWVDKEVCHWLSRRGPEAILIVLVGGDLEWDPGIASFGRASIDALPSSLVKSLDREPIWVDLRDEARLVREDPSTASNRLSLENSGFKLKIAQLQAPLRGPGVVPNDIVGEDLDIWRAARRRRRLAGLALVALTLVSLLAAFFAIRYARQSASQARRALSLQLASQSAAHTSDRLDVALLLAIEAYRVDGTDEALGSLINALNVARNIEHFVYGHESPLRSVAFSADGSLFASSDIAGKVIVRNAMTLEPLAVLHTPDEHEQLRRIAFAPNGSLLAAGSDAGWVHLWEDGGRSSPAPTRSIDVREVGGVIALGFNSDGTRLVVGGGRPSDSGTAAEPNPATPVAIVDVGSGRTVAELTGHHGLILGVDFGDESDLVAVASSDGSASLWNLEGQPKRLASIAVSDEPVADVSLSADGHLLATASWDSWVRIWDISKPATPELMSSMAVDDIVRAVQFSPDGALVASADRSHHVTVWALNDESAEPVFTGRHAADVWDVAFDPTAPAGDPRMASASADLTAVIWRPMRPAQRAPLIAGRIAGGTVRSALHDESTGLLTLVGDVGPAVRTYRVAGSESGPASVDPVLTDEHFLAAAIDPSTGAIAGGTVDGSIWLWNPEDPTSEPRRIITAAADDDVSPITSIAFKPDGSLIAAGLGDGEVLLVSRKDGAYRATPLRELGGRVWDLTFSPDGRHLASSSGGQEVDVWDIDMGDPQTEDPRHLPAATEVVTSIRYSHDARFIIVGDSDGSIAVMDATSGIRVGPPMTGHTAAVQALALDPEGRLLVSVSSDGTAILWNFATQEALTEPLAGHPDRIFDATWIADGSALVTAGRNATLLWDVRSGRLRELACDVVGRDLTLSEWRSFLGSRSYEKTCAP